MSEIQHFNKLQQRDEQEHSSNSNESPTATSPLIKKQQNNSHSSDRNAADESVSFIDKEDSKSSQQEEGVPPPDKYRLVYFILLLHGIGVLLPWNSFLTIGYDYFVDYKLNGTDMETEYRRNFFNYLTAFAQIPNLGLSLLNLFMVMKGGLHRRIYTSLGVVAVICLITITLVFVDTYQIPFGFFIFTMACIVVLNSANGIYQNSIWGLVADFPGHFTNAIVLGNNLCGILMTVLYLIIVLFKPKDMRVSASVFFGLAFLTVIACIVSFHFLPKLPFYKYYVRKAAKVRRNNRTDILHEAEDIEDSQQTQRRSETGHPSLATYLGILKEAWHSLFNVWIIFFTTLAIFPTVLLNVKLYPTGRTFDIFTYGDEQTSEQLFRQLSIFLNFNLFATLGSFTADFVQWPSPKYLTIPAVGRLIFLPLFWACNYQSGDKIRGNVFVQNEWAFVLLITLMAITHGYWSSLSMMYAPQCVDSSKSQIVGMMSGFFLVFGIAVGIFFTFFEPSLAYFLFE